MVLPILVLSLVAILPYYHVPTWQTWHNLTMSHFQYVWATPRVHKAFINSLILALARRHASACLLASLASYITVRTKIAGRGMIEGLVFIPWAFPGTAMALGLLWAYVDFPIPVYATIWIILIAYVTRFLPYGLRAVTSTIIQVHKELEEASIVCGAGFLATFRRVLIPMMRPGVMAGWIILVTIFMREFSATLFLIQPRRRTARTAALLSLSRRHARPGRRHRPGHIAHLGHLNRHRATLLALGHEMN